MAATAGSRSALAIMLVCTDAALGLPMITNPRLPSRIRQGLNTESGLDDGVRVRLLIISSPWPRPRKASATSNP